MMKFNNLYLYDSFVSVGKTEGEGPLKVYFDSIKTFDVKTYNEAETLRLKNTIYNLLEKNDLTINSIDLALCCDLSNQLAVSYNAYRTLNIEVFGLYSACASLVEAIILGGYILEANNNDKTLLITSSSHNQNAERQFRNPNEYGGDKNIKQTTTVTAAVSLLLTNKSNDIKFTEFTIGKVIDVEYKCATDFGGAMAPAAIESLILHFKKYNSSPQDYDLILTGDLSKYGYDIVKKELEIHYGKIHNYMDCGLLIFDINKQAVNAGGSGASCLGSVVFSYIKKEMEKKKYNKVLLAATGALINSTTVLEHETIPSICHIIVMEMKK